MKKIVEIWQDEVDGMKVNYHHDIVRGTVDINATSEMYDTVSDNDTTEEKENPGDSAREKLKKELKNKAKQLIKNKGK